MADHRRRIATAGALLLLLAGASGIAWRFEIEARGWAGLAWIRYFHAAFPAAMLAFVVWALVVARAVHALSLPRLAILGVCLFAIGGFGLFFVPWILRAAYGGWGGGLLSLEIASDPRLLQEVPALLKPPADRKTELLLRDLAFWTAWMTPTLALWVSLRAVGIRSQIWSIVLSGMIQFWSWPVACWALAILAHKGGSNPIHALKSGFVIPGLVVAVGLLFLAAPPPPPPSP